MTRSSGFRLWKIIILLGLLFMASAAGPAGASPLIASFMLEPSPSIVGPAQAAIFDVYLRDYQPDNASDAIISIGLDVSASDPALTGGGTDYSGFGFTLDAGLSGILGGVAFDSDITDDGRVEFGADTPPFGTETGILQSMGDVKVGTLSVTAPATPGTSTVALATDPGDPYAGGTFLLIDDGSLFGVTAPGDGALNVTSGIIQVQDVQVIPEPSSVLLWGIGAAGLLACRWPKRRCRE